MVPNRCKLYNGGQKNSRMAIVYLQYVRHMKVVDAGSANRHNAHQNVAQLHLSAIVGP